MFEQLDPGKDEQRQLMSMNNHNQILQQNELKAQETFIYIVFHLGFSDQSWLWVPETVEEKPGLPYEIHSSVCLNLLLVLHVPIQVSELDPFRDWPKETHSVNLDHPLTKNQVSNTG